MPESDSQLPSIRLAPLLGVNQRAAINSTPAGEWETLEGLYPDQSGELARIPGKTLYATVAGNPAIFNLVQTNDGSGNILVQTAQDLRAYTLDELLGRATTPNIILTPLTDDETMPQAVLLQIEPNTGKGGSLRGYISGTDSTSVSSVFFGRRLTQMPINESGIVVSSVLTPSSGAGSGANSDATPGSFTLAPGTYRIRFLCTFYSSSSAAGGTFQCGLWNATASRFEYHNSTGGTGTQPIISTTGRGAASGAASQTSQMDTTFIVTGGNATYQIQHAWTPASASVAMVQSLTFGGQTDPFSGTVNGSAAQTVYAYVILNKIA